MIEIKCTEEQKEIIKEVLAAKGCVFNYGACGTDDCRGCYDCVEKHIKWDIQPEPLKPCPCCGGEAEYAHFTNNTYVYCKSCHLQTIAHKSETRAAEAWNRRVTS